MNTSELIQSSKVNSESLQWEINRVDHFLIPPDTDLHNLLCCVWNHMNVDIFVKLYVWDLSGVIE